MDSVLESTHVQHVQVIEPLVAIEAAEDVDPLGACDIGSRRTHFEPEDQAKRQKSRPKPLKTKGKMHEKA